MDNDTIGVSDLTNTPRRWISTQGIPLDHLHYTGAGRNEAEAALSKNTDNKELVAELATRTINLSGVGLVVKLPYFSFGSFSAAAMSYYQWPEHVERGYVLAEAVRICSDERSNPLAELSRRRSEAEAWARQAAAVEEARNQRLRQAQQLTAGWGRVGSLARLFLRAASRLPLAERAMCIELANAAVEESHARTSDGVPSFDEPLNALIRQLGARQ